MTTPAPPGWYPDGGGAVRWWDGQQWGPYAPPPAPGQATGALPAAAPLAAPDGRFTGDTSTATLAHVLAIFFPVLGPLVMFLVEKDRSPFARHHAAEALNFGITLVIAGVVSVVLVLVLVGLLLLVVLPIAALVLHIVAAAAAGRGEWYRYPFTLRLVT